MDRKDFVFSSSAVRSLESKLLTKEEFDRMIDAADLEQAVKVLQETVYSEGFSRIDRPEDYDKALSYELEKFYREIETITPNQDIIDIATLKYDNHNMKVLFKDHIMGTDNFDLIYPMGTIDVQDVSEEASEGRRKELDNQLQGLATDAVYTYSDTLNLQDVDLAVERRFYTSLLDFAEETDVKMIEDYANDYIDFSNIIALFRMQNQNRDPSFIEKVITTSGYIYKDEIIAMYNNSIDEIVRRFRNARIGKRLVKGFEEYQETGRLSSFEKEFDNHLMDMARDAKFISHGPEVIFAYLISKEMEIKNLRIVLVSKLNQLSPESIRERLRDIYV